MKKKLGFVLLAVAVMVAIAMPVTAAQAKNPADSNTATVTGCGFHCTADGENGKACIVGQPKDFGKDAVVVLSRDSKDPTVWHLVSINGNSGPFVCACCGSSDWVSFSNKSSVPDGKNIQLSDVKKPVVPDKAPVAFELEVYHIVGKPGDAPDPSKVLYYDGNSQNTYIPGKGEFFTSQVVNGVRGLFDVNGYNVEWLNETAPEVYTIFTLYGAAARENLPADQAFLKMPYVCTDIQKISGNYDLTTDMNNNLSTATITPVGDGRYVLIFWYGDNTPPVTPGTQDIIDYYAICQLWNDLVWGNDGYGLTQNYNISQEIRDNMMPVGIDHRTALMAYWNTDNMNVRYLPFSPESADFCKQWSSYIRYTAVNGVSLQSVCDSLGINIDDFIASYDWQAFVARNGLEAAP